MRAPAPHPAPNVHWAGIRPRAPPAAPHAQWASMGSQQERAARTAPLVVFAKAGLVPCAREVHSARLAPASARPARLERIPKLKKQPPRGRACHCPRGPFATTTAPTPPAPMACSPTAPMPSAWIAPLAGAARGAPSARWERTRTNRAQPSATNARAGECAHPQGQSCRYPAGPVKLGRTDNAGTVPRGTIRATWSTGSRVRPRRMRAVARAALYRSPRRPNATVPRGPLGCHCRPIRATSGTAGHMYAPCFVSRNGALTCRARTRC